MRAVDAGARLLLFVTVVGLATALGLPAIAGPAAALGRPPVPNLSLAFPSTPRENESASLAADMALRLGLGNVTGFNVTYDMQGLHYWYDGLNNSLNMITNVTGSAEEVARAPTQSGAVIELHYNATWPESGPYGSFLFAEVSGYPRNLSTAGSPRAFLSGTAIALGVTLDGTEELSQYFYGTYAANDKMSATLYRPAFGKPVEFGNQFQVRAWSSNGTVEVLRLFPWMSAIDTPSIGEPQAFIRATTFVNESLNSTHFSLTSWIQQFAFDARTGRFAYSFRLTYAGEDFAFYGTLFVTVWVDAQTGGVLLFDWVHAVSEGGPPPSLPLLLVFGAVLASAILIAMGLVSALDESARFLLLNTVAFPFFSLRREQTLDHFVRGQIYEYLQSHPGATFTDIKDHFSLNNGTAAHHLMVLEKMGFLVSKRDGRTKRFFRVDAPTRSVPSTLSPLQYNILHVLAQESPSQADLARRLASSKQRVSHNVKRLRRDGYLDLGTEDHALHLTSKGAATLAEQAAAVEP
jgi:DNA-binding MarR family transcriptional regulator